jgi:hypothetical protein
MLVEGVSEEDDVFMASLMLVLVILLGFDRRCARRNRWPHPYPPYSEIFSNGYRRAHAKCGVLQPSTGPERWTTICVFFIIRTCHGATTAREIGSSTAAREW